MLFYSLRLSFRLTLQRVQQHVLTLCGHYKLEGWLTHSQKFAGPS